MLTEEKAKRFEGINGAAIQTYKPINGVAIQTYKLSNGVSHSNLETFKRRQP